MKSLSLQVVTGVPNGSRGEISPFVGKAEADVNLGDDSPLYDSGLF